MFYNHGQTFGEIQRNKHEVRSIVGECIEETIQQMMPFEHILEEYLKLALEGNADISDSENGETEIPDVEATLNTNNFGGVSEEPEEPPPGPEETKNLSIGGVPERFGSLFTSADPPEKPAETYPEIPRPPENQFGSGGGGNDGDNNSDGGYSDDGYSSYGSGSSSGRSSVSSASSGSSRSSSSSGSSASSKGSRRKEHHHGHGGHKEHRGHGHGDKKKKYSFF